MSTSAELLDLAVSSRSSTFRLDLLSQDLNPIGVLEADESSPPSLSNSVDSQLKRTLSGVVLHDAGDVNPYTDLLRPVMVLQNKEESNLGVFAFADLSNTPDTPGKWGEASMVDLLFRLDQPTERGLALAKGADVSAFLAELAAQAGMPEYSIPSISGRTGESLAWAAGTSRLEIFTQVSRLMGFMDPYCNNEGVLVARTPPDLSESPTVSYSAGGRVFHSTIVYSNDLLTAPNRFVVVDTSATTTPIFGVYDIPAANPNSIANRSGLVISSYTEIQGVGTLEAAVRAAKALADVSGQKTLQFSGVPDPRHDTYSLVEFDGVNWLEKSWSMNLAEGTDMSHELVR